VAVAFGVAVVVAVVVGFSVAVAVGGGAVTDSAPDETT
jgi:hypothetical protein